MIAPVVQPFYTAREVVEHLDYAKKNGVASVKIPGFEVTWEIGRPEEPEPPQSASPKSRASMPTGPECGGHLIQGKHSLYCKPCWLRNRS